MLKLHRKPKPVDMAAVIAGIRRFADDLEAGKALAVEALKIGELPMAPEYWAAYPDGNWMP